ncbi:MAG TPA: AsmA family protein [Solimonas sp.]|nr:AsmA family protein [Solimonas sp.]
MAKPLKIVLSVIGGVLLLILGLAVALPLMFDPNDHRAQIAEVVKKETGRDFALGELSLKVFPWLRLSIREARLSNAPGFGEEPFAQVGELSVGVKLLPLLMDQRIEVSTLRLIGLRANLARNAEGRSNWDDLVEAQKNKPEEPESPDDGERAKFSLDQIGGIEIEDAALSYRDAQAGKSYRIEALQLATGAIRGGEPVEANLGFRLSSDAPKATAEIAFEGLITAPGDQTPLLIENLVLQLKAQGFDLDIDTTLRTSLHAELDQQVFSAERLSLEGTVAGKSVPGGKQAVQLDTGLSYRKAGGELSLKGLQLKVLGLALSADIQGQGLDGDAPQLSGPLRLAPFSPREVLAILGGAPKTADPKALSSASLQADYSGGFKAAALRNLQIRLDETQIRGSLAIKDFATQALEFALKGDSLDADRYLPPKTATEQKQAAAKPGAGLNDIRLPNELLQKLNANGTFDIANLKLNGVKLSDVRLRLTGSGVSAAKQQEISAQLYGGKLQFGNRMTPGKTPSYALKTQLTALSFAPFLKDLLGKEYLSGLGSVTLDVGGEGQTVGDLRRTLDGNVALRVENGAVRGFNLGEVLRKGQALLAGNLNYQDKAIKETDFAAIAVTARIVNGILRTDDLAASSPLFRLAGSGEIDLVNETINYLAKPTVVETSQGQGGKGLEQLKGLTIPIKLTGSLYAPKYKLDLDNALKQKATESIRQELKGREDELKQKVNDKLGELLFGKKKKPAQEPTSVPAQEPAPAPAPSP